MIITMIMMMISMTVQLMMMMMRRRRRRRRRRKTVYRKADILVYLQLSLSVVLMEISFDENVVQIPVILCLEEKVISRRIRSFLSKVY